MADSSTPEVGGTPADDGAWLLPHLRDLGNERIPNPVRERITAALAAEPPIDTVPQAQAPSNTVPQAQAPSNTVPQGHAPASPAVGTAGPGGPAAERARRRWWPAVLAVAAAGVVGVVVVSSLQTPDDGRITGPMGDVVPVASGTEYTPEAMTELVVRNLRAAATLTPAAGSVRQANFAGSKAGIDSCLVGVGNPPQQLAMLDLARYRNAPAAVLVFLSDSQDRSADVVVVGPGCSQRQPEVRHRTVAYVQP